MPMTYELDLEAGLVRMRGQGDVTDQDMVDCVARLRADPDLRPHMNTLSDMRGIRVAFTSDGIARMIEVMEATRDRRDRAKAAIVADSDVAYGMARMFEMSADGRVEPSFHIFRTMESALDWLGGE